MNAKRQKDSESGLTFRVWDEWVDSVMTLSLSGCETNLVYKLLSLTNLRKAALVAQGREETGYTRLIGSAGELVEDARALYCDRAAQEAIQRLLKRGVIERVNRREALDRRLISVDEAGEPRISFCYRVCTEKLVKLAKAARAAEKGGRR